MQNTECIEHKGVVERIGEAAVWVNIKSLSACAGCHAKGACSTFDIQEKIIEIPNDPSNDFKVGEEVTLSLRARQGYYALFYGYLLPFLIVLISLVMLMSIFDNELLGGLFSLGTLFPYYIWLSFNKQMFKNKFQFKIKQ